MEDVNQNSSKSYDCALSGKAQFVLFVNGDVNTVFVFFQEMM